MKFPKAQWKDLKDRKEERERETRAEWEVGGGWGTGAQWRAIGTKKWSIMGILL